MTVLNAVQPTAVQSAQTADAAVKLDIVAPLRNSVLIPEAVFLGMDVATPILLPLVLQLPMPQDRQRDLSHTQPISTIVCKTM